MLELPPVIGRAAVIVAHPDDETLWAGGLILSHPDAQWFVACLTRASDPDRAPKFRRAIAALGAQGAIADLDDGPDQAPIDDTALRQTILDLLPPAPLALVLTHGPDGEYTRHRRHEEVSHAVIALWLDGTLEAESLWLFAYADNGPGSLPAADAAAGLRLPLSGEAFARKYQLVTDGYGFAPPSWEARATPREEAFYGFDSRPALEAWLRQRRRG